MGRNVAILQDLQGPKIRLGKIDRGIAVLKKGQEFTLVRKEVLGNENVSSFTFTDVIADVKKGETIYINDGLIKLKVKNVTHDGIVTEIIEGGEIGDHKGLNFPETRLSVKAFTEKDKLDFIFGLENGIDMVALSFVKSHKDIVHFKEYMHSIGRDVPVIAKIEKWEAVSDLNSILDESSAVMVARGDLGVELPIEKVPIIQKQIISVSNAKGKPVITATQMLNSMVVNPSPTRAEVNDIANAIFDGTDAVILSNETTVGKFPVESAQMMRKIIVETEKSEFFKKHLNEQGEPFEETITDAIAYSVKKTSERVKARVIITATESGKTALLISKYKPNLPVLALTPKTETLEFLLLKWGVFPYLVQKFKTVDEILNEGPNIACRLGFLDKGDVFVITAGTHAGVSGSTNLVKVDRF